jgi:hypothetical protein
LSKVAEDPVARLFARSEPHVADLARQLIGRLAARIEPKNGSIHLCRKSAFAGLHPRRGALLLNLRTAAPIDSPRVRKTQRVSANRFHNQLLIGSPDEVDGELPGWLTHAAALADG